MVSAWCIWNKRSTIIFEGTAPSLSSWKAAVNWERKISKNTLVQNLEGASSKHFGLA